MPTELVVNAPEKSANPLEQGERLRQEGNDLLNKGEMADASKKYQEGLLAIVACSDAEKVNPLRTALHLNCSLAELRRGNLGSAVEHASGAISGDTNSTKAHYRRGFARMRLSEHPGHDAEADLAIKDFERALELDPNNAEAKSHLKTLRETRKKDTKELKKAQKDQFKNIFASGKALYNDSKPAEPEPVIQDEGAEDNPVVLSAENVSFTYDTGSQVLTDLSLDLRSGWCVGMFGNNAEGKTTLARILTGLKKPKSGSVYHHVEESDGNTTKAKTKTPWSVPAWLGMPLVIGVVAAVAPFLTKERIVQSRKLVASAVWWHVALAAGVALAIVVAVVLLVLRRSWSSGDSGDSGHSSAGGVGEKRKLRVLHVSSEVSDKEEIKPKTSLERVIGDKLPKRMSKEEKREQVIKLIKAGGFQMYNQETGQPTGSAEEYVRDGLQFGMLSGGQQHLIYLLRCFASRPDVLIGDELLGGLDAIRQPRVLHMVNRLKREGCALLYITCELHQQILVCDSLSYLKGGRVVEIGSTDEVLDFPKHPATKEYVGQYRSLPGCTNIGGKLAEAFAGIENDPDLKASWVPPRD